MQLLRTDLDALDALRHHVGVVHGHQRDTHTSQPAQRPCPHSCRDNNPVLSSSPPPTPPDSCRGQPGKGQRAAVTFLVMRAKPPMSCGCCPCPTPSPVPPVPAQFTTQGVRMVPWAVSTACTLFTPKSSVLTWMPVTGQFSMIWWQRKGGRVTAGSPGQGDNPPHLTCSPKI